MKSSRLNPIHQLPDFPAKHVKDLQYNRTRFSKLIPDTRCGIEGVGVSGGKAKLNRSFNGKHFFHIFLQFARNTNLVGGAGKSAIPILRLYSVADFIRGTIVPFHDPIIVAGSGRVKWSGLIGVGAVYPVAAEVIADSQLIWGATGASTWGEKLPVTISTCPLDRTLTLY